MNAWVPFLMIPSSIKVHNSSKSLDIFKFFDRIWYSGNGEFAKNMTLYAPRGPLNSVDNVFFWKFPEWNLLGEG